MTMGALYTPHRRPGPHRSPTAMTPMIASAVHTRSGYKAIDYPNDTDVYITRDKDGLITETRDDSGTTTNVYYPSQRLKTTTVSAGPPRPSPTSTTASCLVSSMASVRRERHFSYTYNGRNQLSSVTNPNSVEVDFSYDNGGRRTRITDPGSYVEYVYNARNWITDVRNRTTGGTTRYDATYAYNNGSTWDNCGNPLVRTENIAGSTYTTTLRYDNVYRQTQRPRRTAATTPSTTSPTAMTRAATAPPAPSMAPPPTTAFDDNNKLTDCQRSRLSCSYDGNGNLTSTSGNLPSQTMIYNDSNYLTSITYGSGHHRLLLVHLRWPTLPGHPRREPPIATSTTGNACWRNWTTAGI